MPVNSPCAPAAGCSVIASMPVMSSRQRWSRSKISRIPCDKRFGPVGMRLGQSLDAGDEFIHARVVFHRAGAERIHAEVDGVVPGGEAREVADDFDFGQLRKQAPASCDARRQAALRSRQRARRAAAACKRACPARTSRRAEPRSAMGAGGLCRGCGGRRLMVFLSSFVSSRLPPGERCRVRSFRCR